MFKIIGITLMLFSLNAFALDSSSVASAGFSKLSEPQKAEIIAQVTQKAEGNGSVTLDTANEWVNIGERIGKGFAGAAKELGIAANQFAETPVGKWVAFLIVWHFFGAMAVHLGFALLFLIIGIFTTRFVVDRMRDTKIEYDLTKTNIFGNHPITKITHSDLGDDAKIIMLSMIAATAIITVAVGFNGW